MSNEFSPSYSVLKRTKRPPISWQYIAGFFDGEGSMTIKYTNPKFFNASPCIWWRLAQETPEVLNKITKFLRGHGCTVKMYCRASGKHWELLVTSRDDVIFILASILPLLNVKREICLDCYRYLKEVEKLIDTYGRKYTAYGKKRPSPPLSSRERRMIKK